MAINGWPFVNFAQDLRNSLDVRPISIPRMKYTYLVEFQINPQALLDTEALTDVRRFINDGQLYVHVRNIGHPETTYDIETLRSYNKYIKVPKKMEYQPFTVGFHDDTTSMIAALYKEYMNFYHHAGNIGSSTAGLSNIGTSNESNAFQIGHQLFGIGARSNMETRPSVGLKLKPNYKRTFFDAIVIYDLGPDPDSINVYYYHRPLIASWNHEEMDVEDRTSKAMINATFEYEGYYFLTGINREKVKELLGQNLDLLPEGPSNPNNGHARMREPQRSGGVSVDLASTTPLSGANVISDTAGNPAEAVAFPLAGNSQAQTFPLPDTPLSAPTPLPGTSIEELDRQLRNVNDRLNDLGTEGQPLTVRESNIQSELATKAIDLQNQINAEQQRLADFANSQPIPSALREATERTQQALSAPIPLPDPVQNIANPRNVQTLEQARTKVTRLTNINESLLTEIIDKEDVIVELDKMGASQTVIQGVQRSITSLKEQFKTNLTAIDEQNEILGDEGQ